MHGHCKGGYILTLDDTSALKNRKMTENRFEDKMNRLTSGVVGRYLQNPMNWEDEIRKKLGAITGYEI